MTLQTPPWCLHWSSDGELMDPDRQDLLTQMLRGQDSAGSQPTLIPAQITKSGTKVRDSRLVTCRASPA